MKNMFLVSFQLFALLFAFASATTFAAEQRVKKVSQDFPSPEMKPIGSGSAIIIGERLLLTNHHVVANKDNEAYDGFRIRLAPDYKRTMRARVLWFSLEEDLAILEAEADLNHEPLAVYDGIAPLSTPITAYGFPLGESFGVGLTATGGQITRHPVHSDANESKEIRKASQAIWHDARISAGSSGGAIFTKQNMLLGVVWGGTTDHGMAVPSSAVVEFLRATDSLAGVKLTKAFELDRPTAYSPEKSTVYVEVLAAKEPAISFDVVKSGLQGRILTQVQSCLATLTPDELLQLSNGDLTAAFPADSVYDLAPQQIMRLAGTMTLIQVLDDGMLIKVQDVTCKIYVAPAKCRELRAKLGTKPILDVPIDQVFIVGEPEDYITVQDRKASYYPLLAASAAIEGSELTKMVATELTRRKDAEEAERRAREEEEAAKRAKAIDKARERLRYTFTDEATGRTLDAIILRVNGSARTIDLYRIADRRLVTVSMDRLTSNDRSWISSKTGLVRQYGGTLAHSLDITLP